VTARSLGSFGAMATLASFSPSRRFLAVIQGSSTLEVWDTKTGQRHNSYKPDDNLSNDLTSLAWTTANGADDSVSVEQDSLVAVGNSAGDVVVWNVVTAAVEISLKKTNAQILGSVRHIAIDVAQTKLYASSESKSVVEYSLQTGNLNRSFVASDESSVMGGFNRIALSADGSKLLGASSKIVLWDALSGAQLASFVGHASRVRDLVFLPSGKQFLSVDADKFINVWSAKGSSAKSARAKGRRVKTHNKARLKLIASSDARALHVQLSPHSSHSVDVCCLGRNGDIDIWQINPKKDKDAVPRRAQATVVCDRGNDSVNSENGDDSGVFAIASATSATTDDSAARIVCARGSVVQPKFEIVAVEDADGSLQSSTLDFLDTAALLKSRQSESALAVADSTVGSSAASQRNVHVLGARDSSSSVTGQKRRTPGAPTTEEDDVDGAPAKRAALEDAAPDAQTMEERLDNLRQFTEKPVRERADSSEDTTVDFGNASQSLVTILQQALQANDKAKLEYCLAVHDKEIITTTINKLPAVCILPFLQQLVDRLERSPRRGRVLINWIRKILLRHTAYLMTVPDLAKELAALYEIIANRSALYTKFCRLSGTMLIASYVRAPAQLLTEVMLHVQVVLTCFSLS